MKTIKNTIAEYKAPKCKVVEVHVQNLVCTSPTDPTNEDYSSSQGLSGEWVDDDE